MSVAPDDARWYALSTAELATTLAEAEARIRLARHGVEDLNRDVSRSIVGLSDVERETWENHGGAGATVALVEGLEELRRRADDGVRHGDLAYQHLRYARGALRAGDVLLGGLPEPTDTQQRVDQELMGARLARLHRSVDEALLMARDVRDRMGATGELADEARRQTGQEPVTAGGVGGIMRGVARSQQVAHDLDRPVSTAEADVQRARAQAQAVAGAARLRAGQSVADRAVPAAAPTTEVWR